METVATSCKLTLLGPNAPSLGVLGLLRKVVYKYSPVFVKRAFQPSWPLQPLTTLHGDRSDELQTNPPRAECPEPGRAWIAAQGGLQVQPCFCQASFSAVLASSAPNHSPWRP